MTINLGFKHLLFVAILCVAALAGGVYAYKWYVPSAQAPLSDYTAAQPIKEVEKIKVVKVPGPTQIVTVEKEKIVEKLKLPDEIVTNPDVQITATAQVPPYEGTTNAIATMDTKTGQGTIQLKQEPLPLFAFENKKEVGIRGGVGLHGKQVDIYGRWTFARVGKVHVAAYGEATGTETASGNGKAMLDISYRW